MYTSTRSEVKVSASKAILDGLVPDGGLYVFDFLDNNFFQNFYSLVRYWSYLPVE